MSEEDKENLAEGITFTYTKIAPFLNDAELEALKETVKGYLSMGVDYDKSFKDWLTSKEWING